MLSLNQASELSAALHDAEFRKALQEFVTSQRIHLVQKAVEYLRENDVDEARKYAAQEEAYAEMIANLVVFAERELRR